MIKEIYVNEQLSFRKIMELLDKYPELKKITCPPSLYSRISPKYLNALEDLGVEVEPVEKKGRPKKYSDEDVSMVLGMLKSGITPQEISKSQKIPLKTVYYLKDTPLKRGRKTKYPDETIEEIRELYENGVSVKKISEYLKIPKRTVYTLLKRGKMKNTDGEVA